MKPMTHMLNAVLLLVVFGLGSAAAQEPTPRAATLAQQKMCDEQAHKKFNEQDASTKGEYTSHYDAHMNVCYIMVHLGEVKNGVPTVSYEVYDAFENRTYASYFWVNRTNKKYWEVAPMMCWVKPISHAKIECKSDEEFEELVDKYFDIGR